MSIALSYIYKLTLSPDGTEWTLSIKYKDGKTKQTVQGTAPNARQSRIAAWNYIKDNEDTYKAKASRHYEIVDTAQLRHLYPLTWSRLAQRLLVVVLFLVVLAVLL